MTPAAGIIPPHAAEHAKVQEGLRAIRDVGVLRIGGGARKRFGLLFTYGYAVTVRSNPQMGWADVKLTPRGKREAARLPSLGHSNPPADASGGGEKRARHDGGYGG